MHLPQPLRFLLDLVKSVVLYLLVVIGGTVAFLCFAPVFGYLPYSDRPGPGWYGRFPAISWGEFIGEVQFMLAWTELFIWPSIVCGLILFFLARGLELVRTPRIAVAIVCSLISVFFTGYLILAAGWYISIGGAAFYFAILLALVFGALLLPKRHLKTIRDA